MEINKKQENFKRIATRRTNEILARIHSFKNFTNESFYEYTDEEIEKIAKAIVDEIKETIIPLMKGNKNE